MLTTEIKIEKWLTGNNIFSYKATVKGEDVKNLTTFNLKSNKDDYIHLIVSTNSKRTSVYYGTVKVLPDGRLSISTTLNLNSNPNIIKTTHYADKRASASLQAEYHKTAIEEVIREFEQIINLKSKKNY